MYWMTRLRVPTPNPRSDSVSPEARFSLNGVFYLFRDGILRQEHLVSATQTQTKDAFGFKWGKRETYESESFLKPCREWLVNRYLAGDPQGIDALLPDGAKVLDAGCGSGFSAILLLGDRLKRTHYLGVDISTSVDVALERFQEKGLPGEFLQADLMNLPFEGPTFDWIFSEGVLHHTDSPENAIKYLCGLLNPGGVFLFYVYNKKGPVREFADDLIRRSLAALDDQSAWEVLKPLTKLGIALGEAHCQIEVPEPIPVLGIPAGKIDVQRLFYWFFLKAYYRPEWTLEEMNHVNFDWYRPANCHRQTPDQVKAWCQESNLQILRLVVEEAGITVVGRKAP